MIRAALLLCLLLAGGAALAEPVAEARALLERAAAGLERAEGRRERIAALGAAVQAHERALAVLRGQMRRLASEDAEMSAALATDHERLVRLLGALQDLSLAPRAAMLAFPGGPVRAARAAGLMAATAPGLKAEVAALSARLEGLRALRTRQEIARAQATDALAGLQQLRAESLRAARGGPAAADRAELARQAAAAAARAEDLAGLTEALAARELPPGPPFEGLKGALAPPVSGEVVRGYGAPDPWGRPGEGLTWSAPAHAMVSAPAAATLRYAGPLAGFGEVAILEPAEGWLLVLAGLRHVERTVGETVLPGERLGDLGGALPGLTEFSLEDGAPEGQTKDRMLYLELRRNGEAVDPAPWFAARQE